MSFLHQAIDLSVTLLLFLHISRQVISGIDINLAGLPRYDYLEVKLCRIDSFPAFNWSHSFGIYLDKPFIIFTLNLVETFIMGLPRHDCVMVMFLRMPLDFADDKSTLVQVMAWCHQATNHYLNQCWSSSVMPLGCKKISFHWISTVAWPFGQALSTYLGITPLFGLTSNLVAVFTWDWLIWVILYWITIAVLC